jgi:hypothetical protein
MLPVSIIISPFFYFSIDVHIYPIFSPWTNLSWLSDSHNRHGNNKDADWDGFHYLKNIQVKFGPFVFRAKAFYSPTSQRNAFARNVQVLLYFSRSSLPPSFNPQLSGVNVFVTTYTLANFFTHQKISKQICNFANSWQFLHTTCITLKQLSFLSILANFDFCNFDI